MTRRSRIAAVLGLCAATFSAVSLLAPSAASAHPLGNFTVNVYSGLEVSPGSIRIDYVLDMAEIPTFQQGSAIDADGDGNQSAQERQAWVERASAELLKGLALQIDGRLLEVHPAGASLEFLPGQAGLPILRLEAVYKASIGEAGAVTYEDRNYADRLGWKEITVRDASGVSIIGSTVPAESVSGELRTYPDDMLASPLDVSSARFSFRPGPASGAEAAPATAAGSRLSGGLGGSFAALINWRLTPAILILSLFAAFAFGAVHALLPGHGKTITAAYLVASEAPVRTAVVAGLAVSFMHTASVLSLGVVALFLFRSLATERVYPWLGVVTGVVALLLGLALLISRIRARGSEHGHDHVHGSVGSRRGLAALALAGGILPSPTALVVLTGAISYGRVGFGLALILAFSLGLAAALILVGALAVRARTAVERRFHSRWVRLVPVASSASIAGLGAFLVLRGVSQVA